MFDENGFRDYLHESGHSINGIKSRINSLRKIEKLTGDSIDSIVDYKTKMDKTLTELRKDDHHGNKQNALRHYHEYHRSLKPLSLIPASPSVKDLKTELRALTDKLIELYESETSTSLTSDQKEKLLNISIYLDNDYEAHFEVVGFYDLRKTIKEIEKYLQKESSISNFRKGLEDIVNLLKELLGLEYPYWELPKTSIILNSDYYTSEEFSSKIKEIERKIKEIIREIEEMIKSDYWPKETKKIIEKLLTRIFPKIFTRRRVSTILGSFSASKFSITLYTSTINNWLKATNFFSKLLNVYSHELFHAFHYLQMNDKTTWKHDIENKVVKEGLATYIEYKFEEKINKDDNIKNYLVNMWNSCDFYAFPYAAARYLKENPGLCSTLFEESTTKGIKNSFALIKKYHL